MRIVVADAIPLNDCHRAKLKSLGDLAVYTANTASKDEVVLRLHDADIGLLLLSVVDGSVFARCPRLRMVSLCCTGVDRIDLDAARAHNVLVSHVPAYAHISVAEHVFAMVLALLRHLREADTHMHAGLFDCNAFQGTELHGKTLGIYGLGAIGSAVARIGLGFGMRVVATSRTADSERAARTGTCCVTFDQLLEGSDVLSINCTLTKETRRRFDRCAFARMKPSAVLVNTARGGIVDTGALAYALRNGVIAGACIDTFEKEPPGAACELLTLPSVIATPHIACNTREAIKRRTDVCVANVENFLTGRPSNVIS